MVPTTELDRDLIRRLESAFKYSTFGLENIVTLDEEGRRIIGYQVWLALNDKTDLIRDPQIVLMNNVSSEAMRSAYELFLNRENMPSKELLEKMKHFIPGSKQ